MFINFLNFVFMLVKIGIALAAVAIVFSLLRPLWKRLEERSNDQDMLRHLRDIERWKTR